MAKKFCYTDWDIKMWKKTTAAEKTLAKKIYKKCILSKNKIEEFPCERPGYVANAIGFMFFGYDMLGGIDFYAKLKKSDNSIAIKIYINKFNKLVVRNKQILQEIKRIKSYLKLNIKDSYQKAVSIHDYLCDIADYNYNYLTSDTDCKGTEIYDVLFDHSAICCGYSDTFKAICDFLGIECDCVNNDDHEWNRVKINNQWLYLDITWDDILHKKQYFLLPESAFYQIHPKHTQINGDVWEVK